MDSALDLLDDSESDENQATSDNELCPPAVDENNTTSFVKINGARVIDVTYLVDQLSEGCCVCGEMLSLDHITKEVRRGLASITLASVIVRLSNLSTPQNITAVRARTTEVLLMTSTQRQQQVTCYMHVLYVCETV